MSVCRKCGANADTPDPYCAECGARLPARHTDRLSKETSSLINLSLEPPLPNHPVGTSIEFNGIDSLPLIEDDADLVPLLRQASDNELAPLVEYILKKGRLSSELEKTKQFKQHYPAHSKYANEIAAEIQKFGGNSIAGMFGDKKGVRYREVVRDVAGRMKIKTGPDVTLEQMEQQISAVVMQDAYDHMSDEERRKLLGSIQINGVKGLRGSVTMAAMQAAIQATGFGPYMMSVIVANGLSNAALGHGLSFALNAGLTKGIAVFAGPIGCVFAALWGSIAIAGPAYRVTIPCVVQVGFIRQAHLKREREAWRKTDVLAIKIIVAFLLAVAALWYFQPAIQKTSSVEPRATTKQQSITHPAPVPIIPGYYGVVPRPPEPVPAPPAPVLVPPWSDLPDKPPVTTQAPLSVPEPEVTPTVAPVQSPPTPPTPGWRRFAVARPEAISAPATVGPEELVTVTEVSCGRALIWPNPVTFEAVITNGSDKDIESVSFDVVLRDSNNTPIGEAYSFTTRFAHTGVAKGLPAEGRAQIKSRIDRARADLSGVVTCSMKIDSVKFIE